MVYKIGLENGDENRSIAWVLGHPGCFAYGPNGDSALKNTSAAIHDYITWIKDHNQGECWIPENEIQISVDDVWEVYAIDENYDRVEKGYSVNAWFHHDWKALTSEDLDQGFKLLSWSRADLLEIIQDLDQNTLDKTFPDERWSIAGIINHIGGAEWWYLDRLGLAFPREDLPEDPFQRLPVVRNRLLQVLSNLVGSYQVVGVEGEFWSPRKLLRRAVWHERDHAAHIQKLLYPQLTTRNQPDWV
ncbi:MAG: DinB family protein [Anaerolineales bacterium]|nr:DinB family protein [Anaerolineales bacterium]